MIFLPELGLLCLTLALGVCCIPGALLFTSLPARDRNSALILTCTRLCAPLALAALGLLMHARIVSDFSVAAVAEHSNRALPLLYKIAGAWGSHEGSMLLWAAVMACFGTALSFQHKKEPALVLTALCVQGALLAGALAFIIAASNPFARLVPPPIDGATLTPLLQDMALSLHPPMLYMGYVGFSITFSLGLAGLLLNRIDAAWARFCAAWILIPWSALTLGIGLGSWWAYRVLGWGGFWFWDPVENASLLPWLTGTALLHANRVLAKRGMLTGWVPLLAILTFGMSLIGTFLVRSGLITSVHSFASDPARGVYIILYFTAAIGGALTLYALRAPTPPARPEALSREGAIMINNLFFLTAAATVLLGTLYPLAAEWLGESGLSVGAPYFNSTVLPLLGAAIIIGGIAPRMAWQHDKAKRILRTLERPSMAALAAAFVVLAFAHQQTALAAAAMALATWLVAGAWAGLRHSPAMLLAHGGAALVIIGIAGAGLWHAETQGSSTLMLGPYTAIAENVDSVQRETHTAKRIQLRITDTHGTMLGMLTPEYRIYDGGERVSTPSILPRLWGDLYAVTGENGVTLRMEPLIYALWIGCAAMAAGGLLAARRR